MKKLLNDIFVGKRLGEKFKNGGAEYKRKAFVLLLAYHICIILLILFTIIGFLRHEIPQALINGAVLLILISGYFLFRLKDAVATASYILITFICLLFFMNISSNPYMGMWSYCLPLIAFFLMGTKQGMAISVVFLGSVLLSLYVIWPVDYVFDFKIRFPLIYSVVAISSYLFEKNRMTAYQELEKVSAREKSILKTIPDIISETDENNIYVWMNESGKEFFGGDVVGRSADFYFIGKQEVFSRIELLFRGEKEMVYVESWQRRRDGEKRLLACWYRAMKDSKGRVTGALSTARDITDMRIMEERLTQSQRMSAIGRLAGGVAHEINNPLTVILGYSQNILATEELRPRLREQLGMIENASQRCKNLVTHLLEFSRSGSQINDPVNIVNEIEMGLKMMSSKIMSGRVILEKQIAGDIPVIQGRKQSLEQIIVNLCGNAVDAMPDGGKLTVLAAVSGENITVKVSDTGMGISDENMKKIFDPFFTTKEVGKGTGLGLSLCFENAKKLGWEISAESLLNAGSTFTITIPLQNKKNGRQQP